MSLQEVARLKKLENGVIGIEITLPNSPPLVLLVGRRMFVMCGYLNIELAEKLGVPCIRVFGVRSVEDVLEKEITETTSKARELGIRPGVKVKDVLSAL
ncbi:MAG: DUF1805 domain-containing protein [Sulfolobales archaeon]|nr:DUF1805 domain-containing protein [Sulfolobales archaeon]MDW8010511.1 DUF1805 domain-containing protein [Sulfolobales archaeon]